MKKILLDTNAYAAFKAGHPDVITILQYADIVGISVVVLAELTSGFLAGSKSEKNLAELQEFLKSPRLRIFPVDETTVSFYAKIYATLRRKGRPIPTNDLWIAATALQQGCKLCSFDKHFQAIENLIVGANVEKLL